MSIIQIAISVGLALVLTSGCALDSEYEGDLASADENAGDGLGSPCLAGGCLMGSVDPGEDLATLEQGSIAAPQASTKGGDVSALTGGTMHLTVTDDCIGEWGQPCTSTFPSPQCPSNVYDGQPCYPATGWMCYKTRTVRKVDEYFCY